MDTNATLPNNRIRLSLEVSAELNRHLGELVGDLNASKNDVLPEAIALINVPTGA
jgi:hypothetical protein